MQAAIGYSTLAGELVTVFAVLEQDLFFDIDPTIIRKLREISGVCPGLAVGPGKSIPSDAHIRQYGNRVHRLWLSPLRTAACRAIYTSDPTGKLAQPVRQLVTLVQEAQRVRPARPLPPGQGPEHIHSGRPSSNSKTRSYARRSDEHKTEPGQGGQSGPSGSANASSGHPPPTAPAAVDDFIEKVKEMIHDGVGLTTQLLTEAFHGKTGRNMTKDEIKVLQHYMMERANATRARSVSPNKRQTR
ncbi:hypothetical protein P389DRAFT_211368 [Cystobasidium minutum MCA 4210]|uniref:uncharacterized protein n=1 Tax=Cystobasidium minutum MCA 4210 TaxID=1397322 RepID=UPI0034CF3341|eukprot:jgi/Rhomi1/211368/estExt_Genemark1.C_4_t30042